MRSGLGNHRRSFLSLSVVAGIALAGCGDRNGTSTQLTRTGSSQSVEMSKPADPPAVVFTPAAPLPPSPAETKAAWKEGIALYDRGEYPGAVERLRAGISGRSDDAYAHYLLGLALFKSGEVELAEESLVRSSELGPGSVRTWVNLARVRMEREDAEGALHAAETALGIVADDANALHQRGRAEAALGREEDAVATLRLAHDADPDNGWIANTLGYELIRTGRPQDAVSFLERAKEKLPQVAFVRNNLGVAYERTGRLADAVVEYRAAVEAGDPDGKAAASVARLEPLVPPSSEEVAATAPADPENDPR